MEGREELVDRQLFLVVSISSSSFYSSKFQLLIRLPRILAIVYFYSYPNTSFTRVTTLSLLLIPIISPHTPRKFYGPSPCLLVEQEIERKERKNRKRQKTKSKNILTHLVSAANAPEAPKFGSITLTTVTADSDSPLGLARED